MSGYTPRGLLVKVTSIIRGGEFGVPTGFCVMSIRLLSDLDGISGTEAGGVVHELKTWPEPYEELMTGKKTFEFRRDDRGFKVEDVLWLREWEP